MNRLIEQRTWRRAGAGFAIVAACCAHGAWARQSAPTPSSAPAAGGAPPAGQAPAPMSDEELAQLLAPLALYPDSLLSQVLMASTYPLEIVQADRWAKANKSLAGDALAKELEKQTWDPSVKSLVNFPDVLGGLSEKLDWTTKLGDAFLADQKRVLDTVQSLRAKAKDAGNLKTTQEQNVTVTPASGSQSQTIVIESASPEVVYVPSYDTTVVYGGWPYPAYPPAPPPYYPPYYQPGAALVGFGVGLAVGAAWGYAWGNCNWGGGDVDINVNRNTNINNNIDRSKYQNRAGQQGGSGKWQHDASHRQGAAYRDSATANKFGGQATQRNAQSREQYRGRAEQGRQDLGRGGAGESAGSRDAGRGGAGASAGSRETAGRAGAGTSAGTREAGGGSRSSTPASSRASSAGRSDSAISGSSRGSGQTRAASSRGGASRSSAGVSRGGGGGRGGGGRRG